MIEFHNDCAKGCTIASSINEKQHGRTCLTQCWSYDITDDQIGYSNLMRFARASLREPQPVSLIAAIERLREQALGLPVTTMQGLLMLLANTYSVNLAKIHTATLTKDSYFMTDKR